MLLQVYIVMFPENIYYSNISVNEYYVSGKYTKSSENILAKNIVNASENILYINLIFKQTFQKMSKFNKEQTQQERAQRFRNQIKCRSEAIQKGQYLLDENVIELVDQKTSGSIENISPVPMIDEHLKENRGAISSRRSMTTLPEMGRSFSTERYYKLVDGESDQKMPLNMTISIYEDGEDNFEVEEKPKIKVKEFNKRFISVVDRIYERILSENKRKVHLDLLDDFEPFTIEYAVLAREIAFLDINEANEQERLAIFINIYNMMLIHISYKYGLPGTIWQRRKVKKNFLIRKLFLVFIFHLLYNWRSSLFTAVNF